MKISMFTSGGPQTHLRPATEASNVLRPATLCYSLCRFVRIPNNARHSNSNNVIIKKGHKHCCLLNFIDLLSLKSVDMNYYSYGEHCWVFLQICINLNTKWRASNTFEATVAGPPQVNMEISISNTVLLCRSNVIKGYKR